MAIRRAALPHNKDEGVARQLAAMSRRISVLEGNPFIRESSDASIHGAAINGGNLQANVSASSIVAGQPGHSVTVNGATRYGAESSLHKQLSQAFEWMWTGEVASGGGGGGGFFMERELVEEFTAPPVSEPYSVYFDKDGVIINAPLTINGVLFGGSVDDIAWGRDVFTGNGTNTVTYNMNRIGTDTDGQKIIFAPAPPPLDSAHAWPGEIHSEDAGSGGTTFPVKATRSSGIFNSGESYGCIYIKFI